MIRFAGTFHRDTHGEWVKCMTEGGKPCSRHSGGEHIAGASLEDALAKAHEDDDFGMGDDMDAAPSVSSTPVKKMVKKPVGKVSLKKAEPVLDPPSPVSTSPGASTEPLSASIIHHDESATMRSVADDAFPGVPSASELVGVMRHDMALSVEAMSPVEFSAMVDYTGSVFSTVTRYLCVDGVDSSMYMDDDKKAEMYGDYHDLDGFIGAVHHAVGHCEAPADMLVYRTRFMAGSKGRSREEKAFYDAVEHGDGVMVKTNFNSTTVDADNASIHVALDGAAYTRTRYVIKVPKGTKGAYVQPYSSHEGEHEFLLDKGYSYKVVGIYERGSLGAGPDGDWDRAPIIALEVVPRGQVKE